MTDHGRVASPAPQMNDLGFDPDALRAKYRAERDRRIRPDGNAQYRRAAGEFGYYATDPYTERTPREPVRDGVEVLIIGAGFGGSAHGCAVAAGGFLRRTRDGRGR